MNCVAVQDLRRREALVLVGALFLAISACEGKTMSKTVTLDLVVFSYLSRPIYDVFLNGKGGDSSGVYPETGGSTISGVQVTLGPQQATWRLGGPEGMAHNGERVVAKNAPDLSEVDGKAAFVSLHIYPDDMIEVLVSEHYPRPTARGEAEFKKLGAVRGK